MPDRIDQDDIRPRDHLLARSGTRHNVTVIDDPTSHSLYHGDEGVDGVMPLCSCGWPYPGDPACFDMDAPSAQAEGVRHRQAIAARDQWLVDEAARRARWGR